MILFREAMMATGVAVGVFAASIVIEFILIKLGLFRDINSQPTSARRWGRILSILIGIAFIVSGVGKVVAFPPMVAKFTIFNLLAWFPYVGMVEIVVGFLLLYPVTYKIGMILGTATVGGAIATHLPAHSDGVVWAIPAFSYTTVLWLSAVLSAPELFPVYISRFFHKDYRE